MRRTYNKYPDNPYCKRPKDSAMRQWCRCTECMRYEREQDENVTRVTLEGRNDCNNGKRQYL